MRTCPVCRESDDIQRMLCRRCSRSFEAVLNRDVTRYALIVWASRRAIRFERARARKAVQRRLARTVKRIDSSSIDILVANAIRRSGSSSV